MQARYIEVKADVRYWEDAYLNGRRDVKGEIPLRSGNTWEPVIDLETGHIIGWPAGAEADIHYKVCDAGEYWLLDEGKKRISKWKGCYVPNDILCVSRNGYGDYIIFKVGGDGKISNWHKPGIDDEEWEAVPQ